MPPSPDLSPDLMSQGKIPGEKSGIEVRKTICSICNPLSHCGIDAYVRDGGVIKVDQPRY